jgi:hypothetical protein
VSGDAAPSSKFPAGRENSFSAPENRANPRNDNPNQYLVRIWRSRPAAEFWALLGSGSGILLHFRDIA